MKILGTNAETLIVGIPAAWVSKVSIIKKFVIATSNFSFFRKFKSFKSCFKCLLVKTL